jgi:hypothetical protein
VPGRQGVAVVAEDETLEQERRRCPGHIAACAAVDGQDRMDTAPKVSLKLSPRKPASPTAAEPTA